MRRRRKEQEEEARKRTRRALSSVAILELAGALSEGDVLELKLDAFTAEQRPRVEQLVAGEPRVGRTTWTGMGSQKALRWELDGQLYSPTGIVVKILEEAGIQAKTVAGPDYWIVPGTGRSMYEESSCSGSGDGLARRRAVDLAACPLLTEGRSSGLHE